MIHSSSNCVRCVCSAKTIHYNFSFSSFREQSFTFPHRIIITIMQGIAWCNMNMYNLNDSRCSSFEWGDFPRTHGTHAHDEEGKSCWKMNKNEKNGCCDRGAQRSQLYDTFLWLNLFFFVYSVSPFVALAFTVCDSDPSSSHNAINANTNATSKKL